MLAAILGGAAGPWVTGVMYDRLGTYLPAFSLSIVLSLVSATVIWLAAPRKVRSVAGRVRVPATPHELGHLQRRRVSVAMRPNRSHKRQVVRRQI